MEKLDKYYLWHVVTLAKMKLRLKEAKGDYMEKCSICGKKFEEYGNNARPVKDGICCDECNRNVVIPKRIEMAFLKERGIKNG